MKLRYCTDLLDKLNSSLFGHLDFVDSRPDCRNNRFSTRCSMNRRNADCSRLESKGREFRLRGYVLRFMLRTVFLNQYEIHIFGSAEHREYWIPAGDLHRLNENIVGAIEVISQFRREV
jgi:hypothetical protein